MVSYKKNQKSNKLPIFLNFYHMNNFILINFPVSYIKAKMFIKKHKNIKFQCII